MQRVVIFVDFVRLESKIEVAFSHFIEHKFGRVCTAADDVRLE